MQLLCSSDPQGGSFRPWLAAPIPVDEPRHKALRPKPEIHISTPLAERAVELLLTPTFIKALDELVYRRIFRSAACALRPVEAFRVEEATYRPQ